MKQSINELKDHWVKASKERYPNNPYHTSPKFSDTTANGLTKCIIQWLRVNRWQAERVSNTGRPIHNGHTLTWIPGTGSKGTADISATIAGKSVKIEVKIGRDRQSQAQKNYQQQVERAGGVYVIATDFDQFLSWYKTFVG